MELQPKKSPGAVQSVVVDLMVLAGSGLVTYGSWLVYAPAGFIVPGVLLLVVGMTAAVVRR